MLECSIRRAAKPFDFAEHHLGLGSGIAVTRGQQIRARCRKNGLIQLTPQVARRAEAKQQSCSIDGSSRRQVDGKLKETRRRRVRVE